MDEFYSGIWMTVMLDAYDLKDLTIKYRDLDVASLNFGYVTKGLQVHCSDTPVFVLREISQNKHWKPKGLWMSTFYPDLISDWFRWCINENFRKEGLRYGHLFDISQAKDIETIGTTKEWFDESTFNWNEIYKHYDGATLNERSNKWDSWDVESTVIWNVSKAKHVLTLDLGEYIHEKCKQDISEE